jgi:hypothetical protein
MKKLLLLSAILCFAFVSRLHAQSGERIFKKFKGDLSMGYSRFPGSADLKDGFLFTVEPKYAITEQISIGVRLESVTLIRQSKGNSGGLDDKSYDSYVATADYYFNNNYNLRPFAGVGVGAYSIGTLAAVGSNPDSEIKIGGMLRGGIEIKHFRCALEYNILPKNRVSIYNGGYSTTYLDSKNAYFSVKLGFCFGGGPKNR